MQLRLTVRKLEQLFRNAGNYKLNSSSIVQQTENIRIQNVADRPFSGHGRPAWWSIQSCKHAKTWLSYCILPKTLRPSFRRH